MIAKGDAPYVEIGGLIANLRRVTLTVAGIGGQSVLFLQSLSRALETSDVTMVYYIGV